MSGFQFPPPPPPPPPKAPAPVVQQAYTNQRGGSGRGRGDRGDRGGRGGRGRGGGNYNHNTNQPRGQGYGHVQGHDGNRGGARGGQHNRPQGGNAGHRQQGGNYPPRANARQETSSMADQSQPAGQAQSQVDPNALASVMSFMSTPAGLQSMAAFANHMNNGIGSAQAPPPEPQYTLPHHAGQKRKLNDRNDNVNPHKQSKGQQQSSKPPRAKAAVPPPVPAFGFSLPTSTVQRTPAARPNPTTDQKKRKPNLGLTQTQEPEPEESSQDEADEDEEAAFAKKLEGGGFQFEHDGEMFVIRTEVEVAAWIKDRRKNFPTQQRAAERAQEKATKREKEIEFLRRLHGRPAKSQEADTQNEQRYGDRQASHGQGHQALTKKQEELAALRKKLHESMAQKHSTTPKVDLGLGYESESDSGESSILSESSVVSSSEESSDESESGSDDDEAPVAVSSKIAPPPIRVPPPALISSSASKKGICRNWAEHGRCKWSNKCKFEHPKANEGRRMGLYEVMVEQELVKADERMLEAIKFLGQNGFLG